MIAILLSMDMIPTYSMKQQDWTSEDVAKGIQDYLICIEMFLIAIVHSFVFPHTEYTPQAVEARARALNLAPMTSKWQKKRLGRSKYSSSSYLLFRMDDHSNTTTPSQELDNETEMISFISEPDTTTTTGWNSMADGNNSNNNSSNATRVKAAAATGAKTTFFTNESPQKSLLPVSRLPGDAAEEDFMMTTDEKQKHVSVATTTFETNDTANINEDRRHRTKLDPAVVSERSNEEDDDERDEELGVDADFEENTSHYEDDGDEEGLSTEYDDNDDDDVDDDDERAILIRNDSNNSNVANSTKPGFMRAFLESAIPTDMVDSTVGIVKGDYNVERKTLLNHATASDHYDLFSPNRRPFGKKLALNKNAASESKM